VSDADLPNLLNASAFASMRLSELDARARDIFRQIVETYLETGEPVGSRTVSRIGSIGLSPASVRNTMQDLAVLGLLDSPHTSAGRRPTHLGLRLFVDGLLEIGDLARDERAEIDASLAAAGTDLSSALQAASSVLSGLTGGAGLITTPSAEAVIRHVEFVAISHGQTLVVLVFADGRVENRIIDTDPGLTPSQLQESTNFLNMRLKGRTLSEALAQTMDDAQRAEAELDKAAANLIAEGMAVWSGGQGSEERKLIVRGRSNLLDGSGAAADLEKVRSLFDELERKRDLIAVLDATRDAAAVKLFIGAENPLFSLSGSALVAAPYMDSSRRVLGALGVIGPTRLNYARVIPMVDYTARVVGQLIEQRRLKPPG
jgi:heat-inducible transcriptional repressor